MKCLNRSVLIFDEYRKKYNDFKFVNLNYFKTMYKLNDSDLNRLNGKHFYICSCNKCRNCLINKRYFIFLRLQNELLKWKYHLFVTLTYDNKNNTGSLNKKHVQNFIKYFKKYNKNFTYCVVGEYGSVSFRPHYHLLLFLNELKNIDLIYGYSYNGNKYYHSNFINKLWLNRGFNIVSFDTGLTSNYILKYTLKSEYKVKQNLFYYGLKNLKVDLKNKFSGFLFYCEIDKYVNKNKKYFNNTLEFVLYGRGLGYVDLNRKDFLRLAPKYQIKKNYKLLWDKFFLNLDNNISSVKLENLITEFNNIELVKYVEFKKMFIFPSSFNSISADLKFKNKV